MTGRTEAIANAGQVLADACADVDAMTPRQAAEAAWTPTGPSVDELEADIVRQRTEAAEQAGAA